MPTTENKPLLVGRSLKSLTPSEIDDLLKVAGVRIEDIGDSDGRDEEKDGPSLHPTLPIFFEPAGGEFNEGERLVFTTWEQGQEDASSLENYIDVGEVSCGWGSMNVVPVVKWFLDHGWRWAE